jgi:hypothetical protein
MHGHQRQEFSPISLNISQLNVPDCLNGHFHSKCTFQYSKVTKPAYAGLAFDKKGQD